MYLKYEVQNAICYFKYIMFKITHVLISDNDTCFKCEFIL